MRRRGGAVAQLRSPMVARLLRPLGGLSAPPWPGMPRSSMVARLLRPLGGLSAPPWPGMPRSSMVARLLRPLQAVARPLSGRRDRGFSDLLTSPWVIPAPRSACRLLERGADTRRTGPGRRGSKTCATRPIEHHWTVMHDMRAKVTNPGPKARADRARPDPSSLPLTGLSADRLARRSRLPAGVEQRRRPQQVLRRVDVVEGVLVIEFDHARIEGQHHVGGAGRR